MRPRRSTGTLFSEAVTVQQEGLSWTTRSQRIRPTAPTAAERVSRKLSDDGTTGDEDAPTLGSRERNREADELEAELLAEEERERIESFLASLRGHHEAERDFLNRSEDELAEPSHTCFADDLER